MRFFRGAVLTNTIFVCHVYGVSESELHPINLVGDHMPFVQNPQL